MSVTNQKAGQIIRAKRVLLGLSQEAVAKIMKMTFQQVQKYEKGVNSMTIVRFIEICHAVKASPVDVLSEILSDMPATSLHTASDRATLEIGKVYGKLEPNVRHAITKLAHELAAAGRNK